MDRDIQISDFDYELPDGCIAKFPLEERDASKLLVWRDGQIGQRRFAGIGEVLPVGTLLVFNDTRVVRARIVMHRASGAHIEVFCLEPCEPADYERAFAARGTCSWHCMAGNLKKWRPGERIAIEFDGHRLEAWHDGGAELVVHFEWDAPLTFGQLLETLGRTPIPPYLNRESQTLDEVRYQTLYARIEGSVAAPTAGLHFSDAVLAGLSSRGIEAAFVTLHVGAGTFLPVKGDAVADHAMHVEHMDVQLDTLLKLRSKPGHVAAVGTTSVRTLESLVALGYRIATDGSPRLDEAVGQWELYDIPSDFGAAQALEALIGWMQHAKIERLMASTRIMIVPGYRFRLVDILITNFHQPRSTLLLLVSAFTGGRWRAIYDYALEHDFRFLSYGDSSILFRA